MADEEKNQTQTSKSPIAQMEKEVLALWEKKDVFPKVLAGRKKGKPFVFYEGPPTANGLPHPGHVMGRCFKDLFLRYKTMRGYFVPRRAGWDTHGLPVEIEVEKQLGIKSKPEIEKLGVAEFNRLCRQSVWKYKDIWEKTTRRIGFWLDMEHPYVTYDNKYIESLWWVIGRIFEKGLLKQDYKVSHFCTRCGTGLSSHEIAQGYKTVKDPSVYVKFETAKPKNYFLVWTTTPWTLPANVALAANPELKYVKAEKDGETLILARERMSVLDGGDWKITDELKGSDLFGIEYKQLFSFLKPDKKAFFVVDGDFVSAEDGTGIVHIAPAYGEDDMQTARKYDLPVLHAAEENGQFKPPVKWTGRFVKDANPEIIAELKERGLIFKEEMCEHEYPHCWRCGTPILYYARRSWFITMSKIKKKVIANNKKINWVPAHIKKGRFGEWLREMKDWAFSRERFWGTPLPVWVCGRCGDASAVSSIEELSKLSKLRNRYFIVRHGEAVSNVKGFPDLSRADNHVTEKGAKEVRRSLEKFAKNLKGGRVDVILASPVLRTRETAKLTADFLGVPERNIVFDESLGEINVGIFDGKPCGEYHKYFSSLEEKFTKRPPGGENLNDLKKRVTGFIKNVDKKYGGKNILIVSHEYPLWILETALEGMDNRAAAAIQKKKKDYIKTGEIRELKAGKLPLDEDGNLDLHRPYIDDIEIACGRCGGLKRRVPEVCDVWFDSGAMPFAQVHFPFACAQVKSEKLKVKSFGAAQSAADIKKLVKKIPYPADFITEGVDQTRGWFYTLLAVTTLLDLEPPYKNVVSQGHILDKHGKKMSKSARNYTDPMEVADRYGVDALRWYFFVTNPVGEPKKFDERDVLDCQRKSVMALLNVYNFLASYAPAGMIKTTARPSGPLTFLDRWIVSRLNQTVETAASCMDEYDALGAARGIDRFLDDLTNWYIRRSRARFQFPQSEKDRRGVRSVLAFVFAETLKLAAPFMPFVTDHLWLKMGGRFSVHAQDYPKTDKKRIDKALEYDMMKVREAISSALKKRAELGVKVRQPLNQLKVQSARWRTKFNEELLELMKDEVNVKRVSIDKSLPEEVWLDPEITPELKAEGVAREIIRHIQQARKNAKLTAKDAVDILYHAPELDSFINLAADDIRRHTKARRLLAVEADKIRDKKEILIDGQKMWFEIRR